MKCICIDHNCTNIIEAVSPQSVPKKCYGCPKCPQNINRTRRHNPHVRHPSGRPQPQSRPQNNHMNMSYNKNRSHYPHVHQHCRQQNAKQPQEYTNERLLHADNTSNEDRRDSNVPCTHIYTHTYTRNYSRMTLPTTRKSSSCRLHGQESTS
ncbi:hypothetical protein DPMN_080369 [Dreissena polymorpha]|uniref:Uncharacterized protein n=1 Tax=Dreissena polymorpha TaxID=45954 RepID=A0A9D4BRV4_DREPO|nr:hypothetical protein DPMN_080369 [Dreissena polymorpha]